jgi:hypothetical protein
VCLLGSAPKSEGALWQLKLGAGRTREGQLRELLRQRLNTIVENTGKGSGVACKHV